MPQEQPRLRKEATNKAFFRKVYWGRASVRWGMHRRSFLHWLSPISDSCILTFRKMEYNESYEFADYGDKKMGLEIRGLKKKDRNKAIPFAIVGMHFDWYRDSRVVQALYGRYFWYLETNRATRVLAAYDGDTLRGTAGGFKRLVG